MISRIIKVSANVISLSLRPRLITLASNFDYSGYHINLIQLLFKIWFNSLRTKVGLLQRTVTWYEILHTEGQDTQWDQKIRETEIETKQKKKEKIALFWGLSHSFCFLTWQILYHVTVCSKRPILLIVSDCHYFRMWLCCEIQSVPFQTCSLGETILYICERLLVMNLLFYLYFTFSPVPNVHYPHCRLNKIKFIHF